MKIKFNSQVFIGNKRENIFLRILGILLGAIIVISVAIKILVGDFRSSDISGILTSILIIGVCGGTRRGKPQYVSTFGEIEFEQDKMTITYKDIDGGKNVGLYSENSIIQYDDIAIIEYGKELNCFRIVGNCLTRRNYVQLKEEKIVSNREEEIETFMHVMDSDIVTDIIDGFEKYTDIVVEIL